MIYFGLVLALAGSAILGVGQRMFWIRQLARLRGGVVEGQILKWKRVRIQGTMAGSGTRLKLQPMVTLVDPMGVQRTALIAYQHTKQYSDAHPVGSSYPVLFDPKHPDRILDTTWTTAYFLPTLLSVCGGVIVLIGLGVTFGS